MREVKQKEKWMNRSYIPIARANKTGRNKEGISSGKKKPDLLLNTYSFLAPLEDIRGTESK